MPKGVPNKRYTAEFKQQVIEIVREDKLSYSETSRRFGINSLHRIQDWERIYLIEGSAGLRIERRGRACAAGGTHKGRPAQLAPKVEEDLITENQRLRAEVSPI